MEMNDTVPARLHSRKWWVNDEYFKFVAIMAVYQSSLQFLHGETMSDNSGCMHHCSM